MTQEELIKEIMQLQLDRQREILDAITRNVWEQTGLVEPDGPTSQAVQDSEEDNLRLSQRLYGILEFEGGPPNDEEVKDMIADYLLKKYY